MAIANTPATHVMSSLAWAETHAVIARIEREGALANALVEVARETLSRGPWRRLTLDPDGTIVARLARAWPLRGADLWHLATAKTLQAEIPELTFFSFDTRLSVAAVGEGFASPV